MAAEHQTSVGTGQLDALSETQDRLCCRVLDAVVARSPAYGVQGLKVMGFQAQSDAGKVVRCSDWTSLPECWTREMEPPFSCMITAYLMALGRSYCYPDLP